MKSDRRVIWLDRGWQPAFIGFCPSEAAWKHAMRHLGCAGEPYPDSPARCTTFEKKEGIGGLSIIVTLGPATEHATELEIAGLICHEATHAWQYVRENMGETTPSKEFEAYSVQAIFQGLYGAFLDTRKPKQTDQ